MTQDEQKGLKKPPGHKGRLAAHIARVAPHVTAPQARPGHAAEQEAVARRRATREERAKRLAPLLGTMSDADLAQQTGMKTQTVGWYRRKANILAYRYQKGATA